MLFNFCKYIADVLRSCFPNESIYSNIDSAREYESGLMLEVGETKDPEYSGFISGKVQTKRRITARVRASDQNAATNAAANARARIEAALKELENQSTLYAWTFDGAGTASEERGDVEIFYGYLDFTITERNQ